MESELDILKKRGLAPTPENTISSPPDALAAGKAYLIALRDFENLIRKLETYKATSQEIENGKKFYELLDEAHNAATEMRECAQNLAQWPNAALQLESGVAYYTEIASVAGEAYWKNLLLLESLEFTAGNSGAGVESPLNPILELHEGYKGGHLIAKHVAKSMRDFELRFKREEDRYPKKSQVLSSFISKAIAEEVVQRVLALNRSLILGAREGEKVPIAFEEHKSIGYVKLRGAPPRFTRFGTLIVFKDSSHPLGCYVFTAVLGKEGEEHVQNHTPLA